MGAHSGPDISTDSLEIAVDYNNDKSAINNGYYNLIEPTDVNVFDQKDWMIGITEFSASLVIDVVGTNTGFARHPINRWGNDGTNTASFVLYHFLQHTAASTDEGNTSRFGWYANVGGVGWRQISNLTPRLNTYPQTYWMGFQYWIQDEIAYGQIWLDGEKLTLWSMALLDGASGVLGSGTGGTNIQSVPSGTDDNLQWVRQTSLYSRKISDDEMNRHWQLAKNRYEL